MYYLMAVFFITMGLMMSTSGEEVHSPRYPGNLSHPDKDMYVIHATVYEVGILTNETDNKSSNFNNTAGSEESVTFYHTNGTDMDLRGIPKSLLTNVTAQSMVGVAPMGNGTNTSESWGTLSQLTALPSTGTKGQAGINANADLKVASIDSSRLLRKLLRRDISGNTTVKVEKGSVVIPPTLGLQSIGLPPLLSLNNKLSGLPIPIPNTSVVNFAKINTLVRSPNTN